MGATGAAPPEATGGQLNRGGPTVGRDGKDSESYLPAPCVSGFQIVQSPLWGGDHESRRVVYLPSLKCS